MGWGKIVLLHAKKLRLLCPKSVDSMESSLRCISLHNPPHFHTRYNEYRAIIDIETGNVVGEMPKRALKLVLEWLELHKNELMENWRKMENGESLATINPLD